MKMAKPFATTIGGKKVLNAKRRVTLHISAHDAKTGASKAPTACAAAKAAVRGVPNCIEARIHIGRAYLLDKTEDKWMRYKTSDALRSEIIAFDRGGKFEPGEYDLIPLAPSDIIRKGTKFVGKANKGPSAQKTKRRLHVVKGVRNRPRKSA
jgi:hypothetical protein